MNLPDRHLLTGMTLGAACATALTAIGPGFVLSAFGEETPGSIDTAGLVRFEDRDYDVQYEDWVATEPLTTTRVKKIEHGRVTYADITTTATGTYSTDAMFSNHIQYPGISVTDVTWRPGNRFSFWDGSNWMSFNTTTGSSFLNFSDGDTRLRIRNDVTCVYADSHRIC